MDATKAQNYYGYNIAFVRNVSF